MILLQVIIMVYGVVKVKLIEIYYIYLSVCSPQDVKHFLNEVSKEQMNTYVQQRIHVLSINIVVKVVKHVV
jgi:hypothetical protein